MRFEAAEAVARAVLYEGCLPYPYTETALENRKRWNFGVLRPRPDAERASGERWRAQAQLPARGARGALLAVRARFHLQELATGEVHERHVDLEAVTAEEGRAEKGFRFGDTVGALEARLDRLDGGALRASAALSNLSAPGGEALLSAHLMLSLENDAFGSVIDPPEELKAAAGACSNEGLWPVLIGGERESGVALASPVILSDDPKIELATNCARVHS